MTKVFLKSTSLLNLMPASVISLLISLSANAGAAITVSGLTNKTVYADKATFTIVAEAGYDYSASLNSDPILVGSAVTIASPDYYELSISRTQQSTGTTESLLVQFIVRNSQRLDTEWGLPTWTPYPLTDSAAAEFADSTMKIVMPASFPAGLDIPVVAWVSDSQGKRTGVNGKVLASGFEDYPIQLFRGVGSAFIPAAMPGTISYDARIKTVNTPKEIQIESETSWQEISGTISSDTDWGTNARIKITNTLTIASAATLTVGEGSVIVVAPNTSVSVAGHITVNGSDTNPVVFTAQDRNKPWGGFLFESATCSGTMTGAIFTASGADQDWFDTVKTSDFAHKPQQPLFYLSNGSHLDLTTCYMIDNYGQLGHGETSYFNMTDCLAQKFITGGQYNSGGLNFVNSALIEFPPDRSAFADADNDALYMNGGPHYLTDCLIGWALDDGIDAGEGTTGTLNIDGCWFESCIHEAMAWSCANGATRYANISDTVAINCGQGIECGYNNPQIVANGVLCTANVIGARFGDNYNRSYTGSLTARGSLFLYNHHDVMNRTWNDWLQHLNQTDIKYNYLSKLDASFPDNYLWEPLANPIQREMLESFMSSPASVVGAGFALSPVQALADDQTEFKLPVRLSTFTGSLVSLDYAVLADAEQVAAGTLEFTPGETVKFVNFELASAVGIRQLSVVLTNPVNAELAVSQVTYEKPYEINLELVSDADLWEYFPGSIEPPADWASIDFIPETEWQVGRAPFGYENETGGNRACIATQAGIYDKYYSFYLRKPFWISDPEQVALLVLSTNWDDGYIAYINGVKVDSYNPPATVAYNKPASGNHEAYCNAAPNNVDISAYAGLLVPGMNILAIQAHNVSLGSSDFFINASLNCKLTPYPGDFEPDGDVDFDDLATMAALWLSDSSQPAFSAIYDIGSPADGQVDLLDLQVFANNWLKGVDPAVE